MNSVLVEVLIVGDEEMSKFNKATFDKSGPTDVISYPAQDGKGEGPVLGQLIVNTDEVKRNSEKFGTSYELELARVVSHGVLHLLGYTDDTPDARAVMKSIEDAIVSDYSLTDDKKLELMIGSNSKT